MANILYLRECKRCHEKLAINQFSKDKTRHDGLHPYCKLCRNELSRSYSKSRLKNDVIYAEKIREKDRHRYKDKRRKKNLDRTRSWTPEQQKEYYLKHKYNITLENYHNMLKEQNYCCAICGEQETRTNPTTGISQLCVDHDHKTGKVRGLLCNKCNTGIGYFKENIDILNNAINYLNKKER